jgi:AraC-like DNA-binding protein
LGIAHSYLLENYCSAPSLDQLAQVSMLSKFHLLRLYREVYRCTPHQYLMQLRLEQAKVLLKKGMPPTEVALQLSFSDRRAFTKAFRAVTGVAPSQWAGGAH